MQGEDISVLVAVAYTMGAIVGMIRSWARDVDWRAVELISTNLISGSAAQIECDFV